jgi:hypothetical protein
MKNASAGARMGDGWRYSKQKAIGTAKACEAEILHDTIRTCTGSRDGGRTKRRNRNRSLTLVFPRVGGSGAVMVARVTSSRPSDPRTRQLRVRLRDHEGTVAEAAEGPATPVVQCAADRGHLTVGPVKIRWRRRGRKARDRTRISPLVPLSRDWRL